MSKEKNELKAGVDPVIPPYQYPTVFPLEELRFIYTSITTGTVTQNAGKLVKAIYTVIGYGLSQIAPENQSGMPQTLPVASSTSPLGVITTVMFCEHIKDILDVHDPSQAEPTRALPTGPNVDASGANWKQILAYLIQYLPVILPLVLKK